MVGKRRESKAEPACYIRGILGPAVLTMARLIFVITGARICPLNCTRSRIFSAASKSLMKEREQRQCGPCSRTQGSNLENGAALAARTKKKKKEKKKPKSRAA